MSALLLLSKGHALESRSLMISGVTFFPFLTSFSRATSCSLSSAAFARLHTHRCSAQAVSLPFKVLSAIESGIQLK